MQYVQCKFRPRDFRAYTYIWEGSGKLAVGDEVMVEVRDEHKRVKVTAVDVEPPDGIKLKAILCKATPLEDEVIDEHIYD